MTDNPKRISPLDQLGEAHNHALKALRIKELESELERLRTENEELRRDRDRLRVAGSYMSNVLYNFKQRKDIPEQDRALMAKWQVEWDRTVRGEEA